MVQNPYQHCLDILNQKRPLLSTFLKLDRTPFETLTSSAPLLFNDEMSYTFVIGFYPHPNALKWLTQNPDRHLIFLESDLRHLKGMLQSKKSIPFLSNERVHLFYTQTPSFWSQHKKDLLPFLGRPFGFLKAPDHDEETFNHLKEKIIELSLHQNCIFSEYLYGSELFYQNFFKNIHRLSESRLSTQLKNQFKNLPVVICGAGPSINEELETIRLLKEKALIIAGGRALQVLSKAKVEPHLTIGIDPYQMHDETFSENTFFQLPLLYRQRMSAQAVRKAHGELLYTPSAIGYPIVSFLEQKLSIEGPCLEEGLNAVNFAVELAQYFGCGPIILVGCDLAYINNQAYSNEIHLNQKLPKAQTLAPDDYSIHRPCYALNGKDQPVYTLWKWTQEAQWLTEFTQKHPENTYFNTSLEGLKIEGFTFKPLREIYNQELQRTYDIDSIVHHAVMSLSTISVDPDQQQTLIQNIEKSLHRCIEHLETILENQCNPIGVENIHFEIAYKILLKSLDDLFSKVELPNQEANSSIKRARFLKEYAEKYASIFKAASQSFEKVAYTQSQPQQD